MKLKKEKIVLQEMCSECSETNDIKYEYKGKLYCKKCYDRLVSKKQKIPNE